MDRILEKSLSARAVSPGRAGDPAGLPELLDLLAKPSGEKLAWFMPVSSADSATLGDARSEQHNG